MKLASRMSRLGTETAFEVLAKAKALEAQGKDIIHCEIGEPDFSTPQNIIKAACDALNNEMTHYTPANGLPKVRETIAKEVSLSRQIDVHPDEVVLVPGGKPIMFYIILALCEEGDEVIYPNPGFPIYESVINFSGAKAIPIQLKMENDFRMDVDDLLKLVNDKTKLIILNSPQNPTGGVLEESDLSAVAKIAKEKGIMVLSDEIYSRILYEGSHHSITKYSDLKDQTIILDGMSKTYAMTGWRVGYGVMNKELAQQITKMAVNCNSCTAAFTQIAAAEAISGPQSDVENMVAEFKARRDLIVDGLNSIPGFNCLRPKGAFYVFPNISETGVSSRELESKILNEAGVAVLSGSAFGAHGDGFLRFSYATSRENLEKAVDRIRKLFV